MKKVGLRYCGGCNPCFDRLEVVGRILEAAAGRIPWSLREEEECSLLLIVNGCDRGCAEEEIRTRVPAPRFLSLRSGKRSPEEIVSLLLRGLQAPD